MYKKFAVTRLGLAMLPIAVMIANSSTVALAAGKTTVKKTTTTVATKHTHGNANVPVWVRNLNVPYRAWLPREKPREVLLCVHGLGFSSESYREFGRVFASKGYAVYALDVRGFGKWMDRKDDSHVDFEACLLDVEAALKALRKAYPTCPTYLVGESMGGAIAMAATSRNPHLVDGLISCVPSSDRYAKLNSELVVGMHYVKDSDKPVSVEPEIVDRVTDDLALRKQIQSEKTNRLKLTPKELKSFEDFMKGNNDAAKLIEKTPVLMLAGFKDRLVKPEGTIELFNNLSTQKKVLMIIGDGEHLLLEEAQMTPQVGLLLSDWIRSESRGRKVSNSFIQ